MTYEQLKKEIRSTHYPLPTTNYKLPFVGGWVGFLSYDLGAKFLGLRFRAKKNTRCPEVYFAYCDRAYLKDPKGEWWYVDDRKCAFPSNRGAQPPFSPARAGLPGDARRMRRALLPENCFQEMSHFRSCALEKPSLAGQGKACRSNLSRQEYYSHIVSIKEYLYSGDTYQVNFSQQFSSHTALAPHEIFQKITSINPSPYQFFCEDSRAGFAVISNSPELLVRGWRCGNSFNIQTRPIKGTIARGRRNERQLLASKKDDAELTMIVDLERNDLGKVCEVGSVRVTKHRAIEKYSHVIHTSSTIEGKLGAGRNVCDVIEALFPGGSVTGCPKKRTVQIIDSLEEFRRGVYCGSAGYISRCGNFEFNIMIRTMWYEIGAHRGLGVKRGGSGRRGGRAIFNAGGGIVVDSKAKLEYEESMQKSKALMRAIAD